MNKKTCIITGANAGIGKAAAIQIAQEGHHVILACRNLERAESALQEVKEESQSEAVELMIVDMSLQSAIKKFVETFRSKWNKLDVLIHNAAHFDVAQKEAQFTEEDIESVWATNHLGPVLLTELLTDALKASGQGRVLTVSSKGLVMHPFMKIDLEDPEFRERKFGVAKAYYQSKLAQVMYTYWLARKMRAFNVTANCIRVTNVKIDLSRYPELSAVMKFLYSIKSISSISPMDMAKTYTYFALAEEMDQVTGKHFDEKNRPVRPSGYASQPENIEQLMSLTLNYFAEER